jgi:hypothetical protein
VPSAAATAGQVMLVLNGKARSKSFWLRCPALYLFEIDFTDTEITSAIPPCCDRFTTEPAGSRCTGGAHICGQVDAGGIILQQRLRWGKLSLPAAAKTLLWTAGRHKNKSSIVLLAQIVAVQRVGRRRTFYKCKHGQGMAFTLGTKAEAVLLECVLRRMCTTASVSIVGSKSSEPRGCATATSTCCTSISSSNSSGKSAK